MPIDVLVTGKDGQLGKSLYARKDAHPEMNFTFVGRETLDFTDASAIPAFFEAHHFDAIINGAAYTAVDKAEEDEETANLVNRQAVRQLANAAQSQGAYFIHVSTDYVYNGQGCRPYDEDDKASPLNVYGKTKQRGEIAAKTINPDGVIVRTSWVYSEFGSNFVYSMLRLGQERDRLNVIFDQVGSPTYAGDLADTLLTLLRPEHRSQGMSLYHYSNEGVCSWYDFALAIFDITGIDCQVAPIESKEYPTPATRPFYTVMNKTKIKNELGIVIPHWRESLQRCLTDKIKK